MNIIDELYQLESKQAKGVELHAKLRWELQKMGTGEQKMLQDFFSKHLKDRICKIK